MKEYHDDMTYEIYIIQLYAPTAASPSEEVDKFYNHREILMWVSGCLHNHGWFLTQKSESARSRRLLGHMVLEN